MYNTIPSAADLAKPILYQYLSVELTNLSLRIFQIKLQDSLSIILEILHDKTGVSLGKRSEWKYNIRECIRPCISCLVKEE